MDLKQTIAATIAAVREEAGLTQAEMAKRLYVTRQAVSRWENGETMPGIDMVKLISATFGVPLERFFDMPPEYFCQCCGMPISEADRGDEADGARSDSYCKWCYQAGAFTMPDADMDQFIESVASLTAEATGMSIDEAVSLMSATLPYLKRWNEVAENERIYGDELRERYGSDVVDTANDKYVAMGEAAHLKADELELAIKEQLRRAMEAGAPDGPEARTLAALHAQWLKMYWPEGMYSPEAHKGLADGYVADERFRAYYDQVAPGAAEFLRDAIHACI